MVTEPSHISRWFSDSAEIDLRRGGEGTLIFEQQATNERATVHITVHSVDPPHMFAFRWVHPVGVEPREGNSLLVEFTLHSSTTRSVPDSGF